jgi:pSer/pThr/pTyr-binding forkhead associated (FHA) protein
VRIAPANTESAPVQLKDGDVIQLGVDYQGRTEDIFRCVRIRVELNREAMKHRNNAFRCVFNQMELSPVPLFPPNAECNVHFCRTLGIKSFMH